MLKLANAILLTLAITGFAVGSAAADCSGSHSMTTASAQSQQTTTQTAASSQATTQSEQGAE